MLDLRTGARWQVNGDQAFPMMSVFKAPVAAAVLARIDRGELSMHQTVTLNRVDRVAGSAVPSVGEQLRGGRMTVTVRRLLVAAVSESDNTAVDALLRLLGGPETVTTFLRAKDINGMRVDMDEATVGRVRKSWAEATTAGGRIRADAQRTPAARIQEISG